MFWKITGWLFSIGTIFFFVVVIVFIGLIWRYQEELPDYDELANYRPPVMTRVHAANGALLMEFASERRLFIPYEAIPKRMVEAIISAEDKNFFSHAGIDPEGLAKAVIRNINNFLNGRRLSGASTITQQVAKNFLLSNERTFARKFKEGLIAFELEKAFTKEKLLELYLNEIYLGNGSYGIATASLNYFHKPIHELEIHEYALLAALPKSPSNYNPQRNYERAIERRNWALKEMFENGYISEEERKIAQAQPITSYKRKTGPHIFAADYFVEEVRRELIDKFGENQLTKEGLSIRTTLDPKLQVYAREALNNGLSKYDKAHGWRGAINNLSSVSQDWQNDWQTLLNEQVSLNDISPWRMAVVLNVNNKGAEIGLKEDTNIIDTISQGYIPLKNLKWAREYINENKLGKKITKATEVLNIGDIIYVSPLNDKKNKDNNIWHLEQLPKIQGGIVALDPHTGRVFSMVGGFSFNESQFNRVTQAKRQPGSAFKPFVYMAALENGYTPATVIMDEEVEITDEHTGEVWKPKNYGGRFYGPSTLRMGIEQSRNVMTVLLTQDMGVDLVKSYSQKFGIYTDPLAVLAMSLGSHDTTLLRMVSAYGMICNGGYKITPTVIDRIQDRYGKTIYRHDERQCVNCTGLTWQNQAPPDLPDNRQSIVSAYSSYQITNMMEGVIKRGTASSIKPISLPVAGKTGTTNDEKDAWFIGYTPDMVIGVYIGFDQPSPMGDGETGGHLAAPIFKEFLEKAYKGKPPVPFRIPSGMEFYKINADSGMLASPHDKKIISEVFKPNSGPQQELNIIGNEQFLPFSEVNQFEHNEELIIDSVPIAPTTSVGGGSGGLY